MASFIFVIVSLAGGYYPNGIVSESDQWFVISAPSTRFASSWNRGVNIDGYDQSGYQFGLIALDYGYNVNTNNDYAFCDISMHLGNDIGQEFERLEEIIVGMKETIRQEDILHA